LTKFKKYAIITFYKKIRLRLIAKPKDLITIKSFGFAWSEACFIPKGFWDLSGAGFAIQVIRKVLQYLPDDLVKSQRSCCNPPQLLWLDKRIF
jgi:hypothetical protein